MNLRPCLLVLHPSAALSTPLQACSKEEVAPCTPTAAASTTAKLRREAEQAVADVAAAAMAAEALDAATTMARQTARTSKQVSLKLILHVLG